MSTLTEEVTEIAAVFRLESDHIHFQDMLKNINCQDEVYLDIETLAKIEFPDKDFDSRTIKHQWKKYCKDQTYHSNVDSDLIDLIKLGFVFYKNEIDDLIIEKLNMCLSSEKESIQLIKKDRQKDAHILIENIVRHQPRKEACINYAIGIYTLYIIINMRLFSKYNDSIAYLMFKRIISANKRGCPYKVLPFKIPIIKHIYDINIKNTKLLKINDQIIDKLNNIYTKNCSNAILSLDIGGSYLEKILKQEKMTRFVPKKSSIDKINEKTVFAKEDWINSEFNAIIRNLNFEQFNDIYCSPPTCKEISQMINTIMEDEKLYTIIKNQHPEIIEWPDIICKANFKFKKLVHEALYSFFEKIWIGNFVDDNNLNSYLKNKFEALLSNQHEDFLIFLIICSRGIMKFVCNERHLNNKKRVINADRNNYKKNSSRAKTDD